MDPQLVVEYTLEAIDSVKSRAKAAMEAGDMIAFSNLMGDLYTLELCLVGDTKALISYLNKDKHKGFKDTVGDIKKAC